MVISFGGVIEVLQVHMPFEFGEILLGRLDSGIEGNLCAVVCFNFFAVLMR